MRFSAYFEQAAALSATDPETAEKLLREVENHTLPNIPEHLILCARVWIEYLHNRDNALRCLYWEECRLQSDDAQGFCELALAYWHLVNDLDSARRCVQKAAVLVQNNNAFPLPDIPLNGMTKK